MKPSALVAISFSVGLIVVPAVVVCYLMFGRPPVSTADSSFPLERRIAKATLAARIQRELPKTAPIAADEPNFTAGAQLYETNCAFCHGRPTAPAPEAQTMFPRAPQLWAKHSNSDVVGVSDDPVGETYWKVKNGIRLTGMPAYDTLLNDTQMWQVSLLLSQADKPYPTSAAKFLEPQR